MDKMLGNNTTEKLKKTRKRRYHDEQTARKEMPTQKEQADSVITKHRITRNLGIYNKAKRSNTILRETNQPNIIQENCQDIEQQMNKDLSKVLDVSSFRINNIGTSAELQKPKKLPSNVLDTCLPKEKNLLNSPSESVTSSLCGSAGDRNQNCKPGQSKGLAFKTPLQEISENLIDSLHPANTFNGRDYFSEVKEQILKVYKQSSVNAATEKHGIHSALHERLGKRKTGEPALKPDSTKTLSSNHFTFQKSFIDRPQINKSINPEEREHILSEEQNTSYQPWDAEYNKHYKPKMTNKLEISSSNVEVTKQIHVTTNQMINQMSCERRESLLCKNAEMFQSSIGKQSHHSTSIDSTSNFDILDFLDYTTQKATKPKTKYSIITGENSKEQECLASPLNTSRMIKPASISLDRSSLSYNTMKKTTENQKFFPHQKDEDIELFQKSFPEVSPLRKPSLKTPSPPRFYRRKMF